MAPEFDRTHRHENNTVPRVKRFLPLLLLVLGGCSNLPRDCDSWTPRIQAARVMEVGIALGEGDVARTREKEIIEAVAKKLGVKVQWREGQALELMHELEERKLPLVAASVRIDSPFADKVGLSQPYYESGETKLCLAVAPGENKLLLLVDKEILARRSGGAP
ncbi:MAG TPA: transporter substrate-binding domain-containing protein [Abditibacteriaceae bacterium]